MSYSYDRTAAKKPTAVKEKKPTAVKKKAEPQEEQETSRTDGAKKSEVARALETIEEAIDAVLDCAPNARDYHGDGEYDSKSYTKDVAKHNERVDQLHEILSDLKELERTAKVASYDRSAADTRMEAGNWYIQSFSEHEHLWFKAEKELKNGGFAGKQVEWRSKTPRSKNTSVPKAYWRLWKPIAEKDVPEEVRKAV